jgi:hypothetical protein
MTIWHCYQFTIIRRGVNENTGKLALQNREMAGQAKMRNSRILGTEPGINLVK